MFATKYSKKYCIVILVILLIILIFMEGALIPSAIAMMFVSVLILPYMLASFVSSNILKNEIKKVAEMYGKLTAVGILVLLFFGGFQYSKSISGDFEVSMGVYAAIVLIAVPLVGFLAKFQIELFLGKSIAYKESKKNHESENN